MQISSFLTLSKQTALSRHLEVTAENLANASTLGYRRTGIYFNSLMGRPTAGEDVSYPFEAESHVDFTEGAFQDTGNPLDLAILGNSEAFFVVAKDGELRITRNGNFLINTAGQLVTTTGETVLDDSSQPIRVNPGAQKLVVTEDGSIFSDDVRSGRVRVVERKDAAPLQRRGSGGFLFSEDIVQKPVSYFVQSGRLETTNVNPISEMTSMIELSRTFEMLQQVLKLEDERQTSVIDKVPTT